MCTVAFVPQANGGYLVGHNRDESVSRARALPPEAGVGAGRPFLAPRDPVGGGSWIAVNERGLTLCVLNAADRPPKAGPEEPMSRGLLLLEAVHLVSLPSVAEWLGAAEARLGRFRAFHLLAIEPGSRRRTASRIARLRWENGAAVWELRSGPTLFVSSGYDPLGAEREREAAWMRELDRHGPPGRERLATWLASHDPGPGPGSVCMHRPEARTVSRTIVAVSERVVEMTYLDGWPCSSTEPEVVRRLPREEAGPA